MLEKTRLTQEVIPFSKPYFTEEDIVEINAKMVQILRSGWLTSGHTVQQFESRFADFIGTKYAVALNSCTAALHSVLLALGVTSGDEVLVPTNTFIATANVVLYVGARPVFVDSDPETFNVSVDDIENRITKKTKAIIVVHLGGNPCDMKAIREIAEEHKIFLIEDCAHAHGATYEGINCGSESDAGCFSFYPTKIVTSAEGGIVTTNSEALANRIAVFRNHGRGGFGPTEIVELGFNYRLSELHAVLGLTQLDHLHDFLKQRNVLASLYKQGLEKNAKWLKPQLVRERNMSSYYAFIVKFTAEAPLTRDELAAQLKEESIQTSVLYHPVHLQPCYLRLLGYRKRSLPIAEELGQKSLALPLFNGMPKDNVEKVISCIEESQRK